MKNFVKLLGILALATIIGFSMTACGGGGKTINSADALKAYLDSKPANSPEKPIKVAMKLNEQMFEKVLEAIDSAGKYVSLNLKGSPLTTIPQGAFRDCKSLVSITIPTGVTEIGVQAFRDTGLTSCTIPESVTTIADGAFQGCTGLTSITIPSNVIEIGNRLFSKCTNLTSVTIGNGLEYIGWGMFEDCTELTSVTIPESITIIGDRAFTNCEGLTSITIPDNVEAIGSYAFRDCTGITSITIPNSVTQIGNQAFTNTGLTSITIPASVTVIGDWAFSKTNLTSVTFEGNAITKQYFKDYAFPPVGTTWNESSGSNILRNAYLTGGAGTYTRDVDGKVWTKQ